MLQFFSCIAVCAFLALSTAAAETPALALGNCDPQTLIGGNAGTMTRFEVLQHVVTHTSYHRGFVCAMFFEVPARPPTMDLPVFLREVPPA